MTKQIIISERDNLAAIKENGKVSEFIVQRGDILLNDIYLATVDNILPSIEAAFVDVGSDKMGFLHAADVLGNGALKDKLKPKQKVIVQVTKEPVGHKGPRVTMSLSLPGRFLVLLPDETGINVSKKITSAKERARLKSIVSLLKPTGVGIIVRTEAEGQSDAEIQSDIETLLEKWNNVVNSSDMVDAPSLLYRDQDLLYKVIRESTSDEIDEIILDTSFAHHRAAQILQSWNMGKNIKLSVHKETTPILIAHGIDKEIRAALQTKVNMKSGGYLFIQPTEALTVIDVNSGKFTSSATQAETIKKTNLEAVEEIARQLKLRNIGGMIIIDFIDMENRQDKLAILEALELAIESDKAKPTIGQISDLGLVELTRHRQGQSLYEIFTKHCPHCQGNGYLATDLNFASSPLETEQNIKSTKNKLMQNKKNQSKKSIPTNPAKVAQNLIQRQENEEVPDSKEIKEFFDERTPQIEQAIEIKINDQMPKAMEEIMSEDTMAQKVKIAEDADKTPVQVQEEPTETVEEQEKPAPTKKPTRPSSRSRKPAKSKQTSTETEEAPETTEVEKKEPSTKRPTRRPGRNTGKKQLPRTRTSQDETPEDNN